jgi:hypothetical protein
VSPRAPGPCAVLELNMACEIYEAFLRERKATQEEWAYFAYPQNADLRGMSVSQSKEMARQAKNKIKEISQRMIWHQHGCAACKE